MTTRAYFEWEELRCQDLNGEFDGFSYRLVDMTSGLAPTMGKTNVTHLWLEGLSGFTQYEITVCAFNHTFASPADPLVFNTPEDIPTAPRDVLVYERTSSSLTVVWKAPVPPNGIITKYDLKYYTSDSEKILVQSADTYKVVLSNLTANVSYGLRVRAYTSVGEGPWSDAAFGFTDEGCEFTLVLRH
jgi:hypothetical protein